MSNLELVGKKLGMTREFYDTGQSVPVTVLKMEKARIISIIDKEKRGYSAIQLGFGKIKNSKLTKQMKGFYAKKSTEPKKILTEIRIENTADFKEGNEFGVEIFEKVNKLKINTHFTSRRLGDKAVVYANPELALKVLNWTSKRNIEDMCRDGWNWQLRNPSGY